jgi:hypothetical protein
MGIDLYETVQGEHLFRHLVPELAGLAGATSVCDAVWTIRSEVVSPTVKTRTLLRYVELLVRRSEDALSTRRRRPAGRAHAKPPRHASAASPPTALFPAVGRDVPTTRPAPRRRRP